MVYQLRWTTVLQKTRVLIKRLVCKNPRQFRAATGTYTFADFNGVPFQCELYGEKKNSLVILLGQVYTLTRHTRYRFIIREFMTVNATILNVKCSERLFHTASSNLSSHCQLKDQDSHEYVYFVCSFIRCKRKKQKTNNSLFFIGGVHIILRAVVLPPDAFVLWRRVDKPLLSQSTFILASQE